MTGGARGAREHVLLVVDDDQLILTALQRLLRREGWRLLSAPGAAAALAVLKKEPVGVIVTDQRMPDMDGIEFLTRVKQDYPDTVCVMLTGSIDQETVAEALNRGVVYKFLTKPWQGVSLKANIREAFQHWELTLERKHLALEILHANDELKSVNGVLQSELEEKAAELARIAQYDAVTSLPNRVLFQDRLSQVVARCRRAGGTMALLVLGIDRFRLINETYGRQVGDGLLREVAKRLQEGVRDSDTVARIGGDEFAVVVADPCSVEDVAAVAEEIKEVLSVPVAVEQQQIFTSVSIGISLFPHDGASAEDLDRGAGAAMRHAKHGGGNWCEFYAPEMNRRAAQRVMIENHLHHALRRREFALHYQPQFDLASGRAAGVEALLRWRHPELGAVGPDVFIPILESTGMIDEVGEWVIRAACAQYKQWRSQGVQIERLAVNLSPRQFHSGRLPAMVGEILRECGGDCIGRLMEFEITESLVIGDVEDAFAQLAQLSALGCRIALDDFGTGYASLGYLTRFPLHTLKIDRSFIARVLDRENDGKIVAAIIAMARSLGLDVIAEGVETDAQLRFLQAHGCMLVQGYLLARPGPAEEIVAMLPGAPRSAAVPAPGRATR